MRRLLILVLLVLCTALPAQTVHVWDPPFKGTQDACLKGPVTLTAYLPDGEPKAAVVVCPGGSYF
jgi:hypothetical protein